MLDSARKLAVVTGASTGIGLELALQCAKHEWDLIIAANEPEIENAVEELRREGGKVEAVMRQRGDGRILITGSIAGYMPGSYQAVYNGTKAFLDSFSYALREELKDTGVTVTCLMPGATETEFFRRADMIIRREQSCESRYRFDLP
jgi:short-subunit dehydrogenase